MVEPVKFGVGGPENRVVRARLEESYLFFGNCGVGSNDYYRVPFLRSAMLEASYDDEDQLIDLSNETTLAQGGGTPSPPLTSIPAGQGLMAGSLVFARDGGSIVGFTLNVVKHTAEVLNFTLAFPAVTFGQNAPVTGVTGAYIVSNTMGLHVAVRSDMAIHPPIDDLINTVLNPEVVYSVSVSDGTATDTAGARARALMPVPRIAIDEWNGIDHDPLISRFYTLPDGSYKAFNLSMLLSVPQTTSLRF